jgi:hypothetical protein
MRMIPKGRIKRKINYKQEQYQLSVNPRCIKRTVSVLLTNTTRKVFLLQLQLQNKSTSVICIDVTMYRIYFTYGIRVPACRD